MTAIYSVQATALCGPVCYVNDATGDDGSDGLTPGSAFKTIQRGVDVVQDGGRVIVASGTYNEDVDIYSKDLWLDGAGSATTFIKIPVPVPGSGDVIDVFDSTVEIEGFTIRGPSDETVCAGPNNIGSGIYVSFSDNVHIHHVVIEDIHDDDPAGATPALSCTNGSGITLHNVTGQVDHVTIRRYQQAGMEISGATTDVLVTANVITGWGNQNELSTRGIVLFDDAKAQLTGNAITGNRCGPCGDRGIGVFIIGQGAGVTVDGNTISDNGTGIRLDDGGFLEVLVRNNLISDVDLSLILIIQGVATIAQNDLLGPATHGIEARAGLPQTEDTRVTATKNRINTGSGTGIEALHFAGTKVVVMEAHDNDLSGNGAGAINGYVSNPFDAEQNWWGHRSGPSGVGLGSGTSVSTLIDFTPWRCNGTDTQPGIRGFQPGNAPGIDTGPCDDTPPYFLIEAFYPDGTPYKFSHVMGTADWSQVAIRYRVTCMDAPGDSSGIRPNTPVRNGQFSVSGELAWGRVIGDYFDCRDNAGNVATLIKDALPGAGIPDAGVPKLTPIYFRIDVNNPVCNLSPQTQSKRKSLTHIFFSFRLTMSDTAFGGQHVTPIVESTVDQAGNPVVTVWTPSGTGTTRTYVGPLPGTAGKTYFVTLKLTDRSGRVTRCVERIAVVP